MPTELVIRDLVYRYQQQAVLNGLNLKIDQPGLVALLGLNGAGKSTLLKLIAGVLPLNYQAVWLNTTASQSAHAPTHLLGYQPERPLFYAELTVMENLLFAARLQLLPAAEQSSRIEQVLEQCHLQQRVRQLAGSLSKGYQQRLGLAMAIIHQPAVLLLDEPTDGMDPQQAAQTQVLMQQLATDSIVIVSSHRLEEVAQSCDRLLILHQGRLVHDTTIDADSQRQGLAQLFADLTGSVAA